MQQKSPSDIKALSVLHLALLMGQVLFALISLFLGYFSNISSSSLQPYSQQLMILSIIVGIVCFIAANSLFRKKIQKISEDYKALSERFNDYRAVCITRWALIEFAALFSIILFLLTNNYIILIVAAVLVLLFFTTRPSLPKVASDLGINEIELEQMI
ncbi:MAG TPA: hypothetical protein VFI29_15705 [Hanamia sp.]|nr:hypothetical protein [Hanamia sp.]